MLVTIITTLCIFCMGFVGGAAWKGIFKREEDASARIDSPRHYTRLKV